MKPLHKEKLRTITEFMFVCPKCYNKTIVGFEKKQDIPCTNAECDYVLDKKEL